MGILRGETIKDKNLIDPFKEDRLQATSYDLAVGTQCWQRGKRKNLREGQIIHMAAHEVVIVSTGETISTPTNIVGHFDLKRSWALRGLIMQCGTQIEPAYKGPLGCILYNLADQAIDVKCGEALFAIEFSTVEGDEQSPMGKPRECSNLWSIVHQGITSAMTKLQQDVEKARRLALGILPIILFILSIMIAIITIMIAFGTWVRPRESTIDWRTYGDLRTSLTQIISEGLLNDLKLFIKQEIQRQTVQSKKQESQ